MKKGIGWILAVSGGFFCAVSVLCIPVILIGDDMTLEERMFTLLSIVVMAVASGLIGWMGFKLKAKKGRCAGRAASDVRSGKKGRKQGSALTEAWMTSQLPALYLQESNPVYRDDYVTRLESIGFQEKDAEKLFGFECEVIRRFHKPCLLDPRFTKMWIFNLNQPLFQQYPKTKEDILKERYLTVSELCKLIDEAEWHFWNSHERALPDGVWQEICQWRLKGTGAEFAIRYFEMIEKATDIPGEMLAKLSSEQGRHLSRYKWC